MLNLTTLDPNGLAAALTTAALVLRRSGQPDLPITVKEAMGYPRAENRRYKAILDAAPGHVATGYSRVRVLLIACHDNDGQPGGCVHLKRLCIGGTQLEGSTAVAEYLKLAKESTGRLFEEGGRVILELAA